MAGRGRETFGKRQRERAREEKKREKAAIKAERREAEAEADTPNEEELFEQFRRLSERHDAGQVTDEAFEERKAEIFEALGLEVQ